MGPLVCLLYPRLHSTPSDHHTTWQLTANAGFNGLFSNHYVAMCAAFATIGGLLFGYE
jgi:hypothetical protein